VSRNSKSFWSTIPGLITGLAGILTALVGLGTLLIQIGVIGGDGNSNAKTGVTGNPRAPGNTASDDSDSSATEPTRLSFTVAPDDVKLTTSEKTDTVTVSNTGTAALTLATEIDGSGADQFTVTKGSCGTQVPKGGSCSMTVSFKGGLAAQAELIVKASGASSSQEVKLEGSLL